MKKCIRVIIKREHEPYGHSILIENTLKKFQKIVGGYIETVPIDDKNVMIVNEEGKILGLDPNFLYGSGPRKDVICGPVIIAGVDGENMTDTTLEMGDWKNYLLRRWA